MKNVKIEELVKNHSRTKDGIHLRSEDMVISILQKNIVEVRLTCGKGSLKTSLSPKALGVDISKKRMIQKSSSMILWLMGQFGISQSR